MKASSGPRYVVGCRSKVDKEKLTSGTRVVLDMTTLTIMRTLPREVYFLYLNHFMYFWSDYIEKLILITWNETFLG